MNERAQIGDPFELILVLGRQLGRADQCRVIDHMLEALGPLAPVPQFEDTRDDATWWMQSVPDAVKRTYMVELFCELSRERQDAFIAWAGKNRRTDEKPANALPEKANVVG